MFIENEKFAKLREAARSGDGKAKAILESFRCDDGKCGAMLEEYFKPAPEAEAKVEVEVQGEPDRKELSKLQRYLMDNNITEEDESYQEYVDEFNQMFPEEKVSIEPNPELEKKEGYKKLVDDEVEAIEGYQKFLNKLLPETMCPEEKAYIVEKINKIIDDEKQHIDILKELEHKLGEQNL